MAASLAIVPTMTRRERLWREAAGLCHWCKRDTRLINSPLPDQATVDHVIPRCRGGSDTLDNVVNACYECNQQRNVEDMKRPGHPAYVSPMKTKSTTSPEARHRSHIELLTRQRDQGLQRIAQLNRELEKKDSHWQSMSIRAFLKVKLISWLKELA